MKNAQKLPQTKTTSLKKEAGVKTSTGRKGAGFEREKHTNLTLINKSDAEIVSQVRKAKHKRTVKGVKQESTFKKKIVNTSKVLIDNPIWSYVGFVSKNGNLSNLNSLERKVRRIINNELEAYEVMFKAIEKCAKSYSASLVEGRAVAKPSTYLYRAVVNASFNHLKLTRVINRQLLSDAENEQTNCLENIQDYSELNGYVLTEQQQEFVETIKATVLNTKQMELVKLLDLGYSDDEIIEELNYSSETMYRKDKSIALNKATDAIYNYAKTHVSDVDVDALLKEERKINEAEAEQELDVIFNKYLNKYSEIVKDYLKDNKISELDFTPYDMINALESEGFGDRYTRELSEAIKLYSKLSGYVPFIPQMIDTYYQGECELSTGYVSREYAMNLRKLAKGIDVKLGMEN
jgi:DNA-directed RNA polymerase specialized sigma24 family protein